MSPARSKIDGGVAVLRKNGMKAKLKAGNVPIGAIVLIPDPSLAELLGLCGFDYLLFDGEHGAITPEILERLVRACDSAGVVAMARLPVNTADAMLPYLETGILGAMLPHSRSAAQVAEFVHACKYAPLGTRGVGTGRATAYGTIATADHIREWNAEFFTIAQVEDQEAIDDLANITRIEGLDACYVGSNDLSQAIGFAGRPDDPEFRKIQARIAQNIKRGGKWVGLGARPPFTSAEASRLRGMGADFFSFSYVGFLTRATKDLVRESRALVTPGG